MMSLYQKLSLAVQVMSTFLLFGSVVYAALQIRQNSEQLNRSRKIHMDNHDWNRRYAAQQALIELSKRISGPVDHQFNTTKRTNRVQLFEIEAAIRETPELRAHIHAFLNGYESLARGVHQGILDEQVVKAGRKNAMIYALDNFWEYIRDRRINVNPRAWSELEAIVNKWKNEESQAERRERIGEV